MTRTTANTSGLSDLPERYRRIRAATEMSCAPLSPEDMVVQSMPDASPAKWHLAHTTWFFETFVLAHPSRGGYQTFRSDFNYLFNSYYEAVGSRHPRPLRGLLTRPSLDEVRRYREHVDRKMSELLPCLAPTDDLAGIVELGLHHEQQHLELLLTDIKHLFSRNPLRPCYWAEKVSGPFHPPVALIDDGALMADERVLTPFLKWSGFKEGVYSIGHAGAGFSFDNERPRHRVFLEPFAIGVRPVSCGEYLAFMNDNGYGRPELWLSDGWSACQPRRAGRRRFTGSGTEIAGNCSHWAGCGLSPITSRSRILVSTRRTPTPGGPAAACRPKPNGK